MSYREEYTPNPASAEQFCRLWSAHVDALERHLDRMDQSMPSKRKTIRR